MGTIEPPQAANGSVAHGEGELATLVRRWMATGRDRRSAEAPPRPQPQPQSRLQPQSQPQSRPQAPPPEVRRPEPSVLPRRPNVDEPRQVGRLAVLIDARRTSPEAATALLARLHEHGTVSVCRAYADWSSPELGDWAGRLRRQGLSSFHHFADDDDQALVAMAIDAVDIAREAAVDEVVLAGDLTSSLPLVNRLHVAGVRVVAVGPSHTPHDLRSACDEFIDVDGLTDDRPPSGRHRA